MRLLVVVATLLVLACEQGQPEDNAPRELAIWDGALNAAADEFLFAIEPRTWTQARNGVVRGEGPSQNDGPVELHVAGAQEPASSYLRSLEAAPFYFRQSDESIFVWYREDHSDGFTRPLFGEPPTWSEITGMVRLSRANFSVLSEMLVQPGVFSAVPLRGGRATAMLAAPGWSNVERDLPITVVDFDASNGAEPVFDAMTPGYSFSYCYWNSGLVAAYQPAHEAGTIRILSAIYENDWSFTESAVEVRFDPAWVDCSEAGEIALSVESSDASTGKAVVVFDAATGSELVHIVDMQPPFYLGATGEIVTSDSEGTLYFAAAPADPTPVDIEVGSCGARTGLRPELAGRGPLARSRNLLLCAQYGSTTTLDLGTGTVHVHGVDCVATRAVDDGFLCAGDDGYLHHITNSNAQRLSDVLVSASEIKFLDFVDVQDSTIVISERWPDSYPDVDYVLHVIDIEADTIGTLTVPNVQRVPQ